MSATALVLLAGAALLGTPSVVLAALPVFLISETAAPDAVSVPLVVGIGGVVALATTGTTVAVLARRRRHRARACRAAALDVHASVVIERRVQRRARLLLPNDPLFDATDRGEAPRDAD